jgi:hypothetical protein
VRPTACVRERKKILSGGGAFRFCACRDLCTPSSTAESRVDARTGVRTALPERRNRGARSSLSRGTLAVGSELKRRSRVAHHWLTQERFREREREREGRAPKRRRAFVLSRCSTGTVCGRSAIQSARGWTQHRDALVSSRSLGRRRWRVSNLERLPLIRTLLAIDHVKAILIANLRERGPGDNVIDAKSSRARHGVSHMKKQGRLREAQEQHPAGGRGKNMRECGDRLAFWSARLLFSTTSTSPLMSMKNLTSVVGTFVM